MLEVVVRSNYGTSLSNRILVIITLVNIFFNVVNVLRAKAHSRERAGKLFSKFVLIDYIERSQI